MSKKEKLSQLDKLSYSNDKVKKIRNFIENNEGFDKEEKRKNLQKLLSDALKAKRLKGITIDGVIGGETLRAMRLVLNAYIQSEQEKINTDDDLTTKEVANLIYNLDKIVKNIDEKNKKSFAKSAKKAPKHEVHKAQKELEQATHQEGSEKREAGKKIQKELKSHKKIVEKSIGKVSFNESDATTIATQIDTNHTGVIGGKEIRYFINNKVKALAIEKNTASKNIINIITKVWESHKGRHGMKTEEFINSLQHYSTLKIHTHSSVDRHHTHSSVDKYIKELKTINQYIKENSDSNESVSSSIGVVGMVKSLFTPKGGKELEQAYKNVAKHKGKMNSNFAKVFTSTAMEAIISYALSGGTLMSLQIMGVNIDTKEIDRGSIEKVLKELGVKDPVLLRDALRGKPSKTQINTIGKLMTKIHSGSLTYGVDEVTGHDTGFVGEIPIIGDIVNFLNSLSKKIGSDAYIYDLLEDYKKPHTLKERAALSSKIANALEAIHKKTLARIKELESKVKEFNKKHPDPLFVLDNSDKIPERKEELEELKRDLKKQEEAMRKYVNNIKNRDADIRNEAGQGRSSEQGIKAMKSYEKYRLNFSQLHIGHGKFGLPIPHGGINDTWIKKMETHSNPKVPGISAMANLMRVYQDKEAMSKNISMTDFATALKKAHKLTPKEKIRFEHILNKNLGATGRTGNYKTDKDIYSFQVGTQTLFIKSDCSNVQDTTPGVNIFTKENIPFIVHYVFDTPPHTPTTPPNTPTTPPNTPTTPPNTPNKPITNPGTGKGTLVKPTNPLKSNGGTGEIIEKPVKIDPPIKQNPSVIEGL